MTYRDPKALLENIFDEDFGFRLLNFSIKPVHVANGLGRSLTGRTYSTVPLARTLRRYVRKQNLGVDQERNPNSAILDAYSNAFEPLRGTTVDETRLNRLRSLALDVLGADGAVYDQADKSSYTLSNERFLTRDPSDNRTGAFLCRLLTSEPRNKTDAADRLRHLLATESDAWTTLALPLLSLTEAREEAVADSPASSALDLILIPRSGQLSSPGLRRLRDSYDRLARFESTSGSKLNGLRRLVLFGCFVLHVHAISRWSEVVRGAPRPPVLLDLFDGAMPSVRDASRATLRAAGDAVEGIILHRMQEHVLSDYGADSTAIDHAVMGDPAVTESVQSAFRNYSLGGMDSINALSQALVDDAFEKVREHPIGALVELGRRAGFLSPWSNAGRGGKLQKRYTATSEFLEILIGATVEPDEPLEFPEFLYQLRETFGIVIGTPSDDDVIRRNNLYDSQFGPGVGFNEEDLRANVERMRRLVVECGYGKAYADGRTVVTSRPEWLG